MPRSPDQVSGDVLLIGNKDSARERFGEELVEAGFAVTTVLDSQSALEHLSRRAFDLVLVDVIPEMDGIQLLRRLWEKNRRLPTTILMGKKISNDIHIQADEFDAISLNKPVGVEIVVRHFRRRRRHRREGSKGVGRIWARSLPATQAKNAFSGALETAIHNGPVLITKHRKPSAVLISYDDYVRTHESQLGKLADEFDALLESMQRPPARAGMAAAFNASPEELGRAALIEAKRSD